jgi:hypothetical protein
MLRDGTRRNSRQRCHVCDAEQVFTDRIKRTLAMNRSLLLGADPEHYPEAVRPSPPARMPPATKIGSDKEQGVAQDKEQGV